MKEDLKHFMIDCGPLEELRALALELQRPRREDKLNVMGEFLFKQNRVELKNKTLK